MSHLCRQIVKIVSLLCLLLSGIYPLAAQEPTSPKPPGPAASKPMVVAVFNGTSITDEDLRKVSAADLDRLSMDVDQMNTNISRLAHQILETNLLRLLQDKLFEAEAAKRGISKDAFLEKELQGKIKEPSEQDVNTFYQANKQHFNQPVDKVADQIRQYLKAEYRNKAMGDLADQLKPKYMVRMLLPPVRSRVAEEGSPSLGPKDAPVTIVEFSDFQCPSCSQLNNTLHEILAKYGDKVRLVYRQLPLSQGHPMAEKAAEASLCAADQNHFWEMHDFLFDSQKELKEEDLKAKAAQLKLDTAAFNKCLDSGINAGKVIKDQKDAYSLAVANSPSIFINGRYYTGALPASEISKTIDEELVLISSNTALGTSGASRSAGLPSSSSKTP